MSHITLPIILFTYPESVVGRRVEWYLTLRGIPYHVNQVEPKMPRPILQRLSIHYRRIPVLAVGRDLYCDSRCIIDHLERLYNGVSPLGCDPKTDPYGRGIERILEGWAFDGGPFARTAQMITPDASLVQDKAFLVDRSELTGSDYDAEALRQTLPDALAHARLHLSIVEDNLLADGRHWLAGGSRPSVSDVNVLWIFDWMMRPPDRMGMKHAYPELLNDRNYPRTFAWVDRMESAFQTARERQGPPRIVSNDEAVRIIEEAGLWQPAVLSIDEGDSAGLKRGDQTDLIALDSAPITGLRRRDVGPLEGLSLTSATVGALTEHQEKIRIHYQRTNVRVAKASKQPRLAANEIP